MDLEDRLRTKMHELAATEPPPDSVDRIITRLPQRSSRPTFRWLTAAAGATAIVVLVVVAVVSRPQPQSGVGAAGTARASSADAGSTAGGTVPAQTDSASQEPMPTPTKSPTPTIPRTQIERSIQFWREITGGEHPEEIGSLAQAALDADLIVVGKFSALRFGDNVFDFEVTRSTIEIEQVLKGEPQTETAGTITLQGMPAPDPQFAQALMPEHRHLLFLHYVPWKLEREGLPPEDQEEELYDYTVLSGTQGVVLDIDGFARALDPRNPARFPGMLEGESFDAVVEATRHALRGEPNSTSAPR